MPAVGSVVINYVEVIEAIGEQFQSVWYALKNSADEKVQKEIANVKKIEVSDEQSFNKKKSENKIEKGAIYIVARFSAGSINYGSSVTPISLYCIGTSNKVKPTQLMLSVFASSWTTLNLAQGLVDSEGNSLEKSWGLQVWNTPEIITNFNEIDADFRNLFRLTGNIVVGESAVRLGTLTYIYDETHNLSETVNIMSFADGYRASLDSQPFGNTKGFVKSEVNFSTYTFSISTYLLNNHISAAALSVRGFRNRSNSGIGAIFKENGTQKTPGNRDYTNTYFVVHKNQELKLKLEFNNGYVNIPADSEASNTNDDILDSDFFSYFKIVDSQIKQEIAGIPMLTITFTR